MKKTLLVLSLLFSVGFSFAQDSLIAEKKHSKHDCKKECKEGDKKCKKKCKKDSKCCKDKKEE